MEQEMTNESLQEKLDVIAETREAMRKESRKGVEVKQLYQTHLFSDKGTFKVTKSLGRGRFQTKALSDKEEKQILEKLGVK